jgi:hypothetical protein
MALNFTLHVAAQPPRLTAAVNSAQFVGAA